MPFLVTLTERDGGHVAGRFLRASDLAEHAGDGEHGDWRTVVMDSVTGAPAIPNGSIGDRWGEEGKGRWNLELGDIEPELSLLGTHDELVQLRLPRFDTADGHGEVVLRGVPARRVGDTLVTTVFDLICAHYGVKRDPDLPGEWPEDMLDPETYTPAWQEPITGVEADLCSRIAREFARNAERTNGRSMIVMGAGTNHWFHSDLIYRSMLNLVLLCGCQGVNGGGWAHYVGQEKVRTITGFSTIAFALDWNRPPRQQAATPFWYLATDQWRYDAMAGDDHSSPVGDGVLGKTHVADCNALAARLGWTPSYPTFDRNPLELADAAKREGATVSDYIVDELKAGRLRFACEDPDDPDNFPRVLTIWRSNLLGSSSKGHEYFLKHLLGIPTNTVTASETPPEHRPKEVRWRDEAPEGKLDLLVTLDFRMAGTALHSDVVLPAATWYEKHDISTTDLHPFVHSFNPAITPPWETATDWDIFNRIAGSFSRMAPSTSAPARTSSPRRFCTTAPTSWPSRSARSATGARDIATQFRDVRCRSSSPSNATTASSTTRCGRSGRSSRSSARPGRASRSTPSRRCESSARATACRASASPKGARGSIAPTRSARRSSRCRARRTGGSPSRASRRSSSARARSCATSPRAARTR